MSGTLPHMPDRTFEMDLERQFAESPVLRDADLFALRVSERLDRGWRFRQILIGGLGLAGGVIGAMQILGSGVFSRARDLASRSDLLGGGSLSDALANSPVGRSAFALGLKSLLAAGTTMDGQVLWMSAVLAALALGLLVTRAIREI